MKKLYFLIISISLVCLYSCGGGSGSTGESSSSETPASKPVEFDYMMLSKPEELKKVYDMVLAKLGDNVRYVDRIDLSVNYPKGEGSRDSDDSENFSLTVVHLNEQNKNRLTQHRYFSGSGEWQKPEIMEVELMPGSDVESFVLQDEMMDLSGLTFEKLNKVVQDEFNKFKDEEKYNLQYVKNITITEYNSDREPKMHIYMNGQLKSNEMIKEESPSIPLRKVLQ